MKIKKNYFDIITCFEVIEHVLDVNAFVNEVYTYLKPGGLFIFSTPNNKRIQIHEKWDYPPIHVSRFKKMNIEILLKSNKFSLRSFKTFNELGYYSGNLIAKLKFSHQALEKFVEASSDQQSQVKAERSAQLFKFLAKAKKSACTLIDLPLYHIS